MRPRCVLLDRDGVINVDSEAYILDVDDWRPIPGSLEAIARLSHAGIQVAVCTNQSAVGRGMLSMDGLARINAHMREAVKAAGGQLSGVFFCPHAPGDSCPCRKPAPGLIRQALAALDCPAAAALFIGDSQRDLDAARRAGIAAWLVRTGNGRRTEAEAALTADAAVYDDLASATRAILDTADSRSPAS